ncbi:MAG: hypothetical protein EOP81_00035 [Variovorax sp.]|nr:MAG: hypothetical protein EOP81_00035 [Variovorax sp.]
MTSPFFRHALCQGRVWATVAASAFVVACGGGGSSGQAVLQPIAAASPEQPVTPVGPPATVTPSPPITPTDPPLDSPVAARDCEAAPRHESPEPGSAAWKERDADNLACASERIADFAEHPAALFKPGKTPAIDAYRVPALHADVRFRFLETTAPSRGSKAIAIELYRPCDAASCPLMPATLARADGPYPAVVVVHGGGSSKRLHRSATQSLAEAGYMTIALDTTSPVGTHGPDTQDVIDWLFSTPTAPRPDGSYFPWWASLDIRMVGIAGHSQGASTASLIGQTDPRLSAIVAWDNLTALRTGWVDKIGIDPPADLILRTPALGFGADYNFVPEALHLPPEPAASNTQGGRGRGAGPHPKDPGYQELRAAGIDTMLIVPRAATHLDYSLFGGPATRLGESVINYYTLAWFDRYLKGAHDPALAQDAFLRLTATTFSDAADRHNISQGRYSAAAADAAGSVMAGNQPYRIAGLPVRDRLSFYFKSRCHLGAPDGTRMASEDVRAQGCAAP